MRLAPVLTVIISALSTTAALAGYPQENVRVCGVTTHRLWYGEPTPGIIGTSSTGLQNEYVRIRTTVSVSRDEKHIEMHKHLASLEFRSAIQIEGIKICATGDLYSEISKKTLGKTIYSIKPFSYEIITDELQYLRVAEVLGQYIGQKADLRVLHLWERDSGNSLMLKDTKQSIAELLKEYGTGPCRELSAPGPVRFQVTRTSNRALSATLDFNCDRQHPNDVLKIQLRFSENQLSIDGVRAAKNLHFSWMLDQVKPSL